MSTTVRKPQSVADVVGQTLAATGVTDAFGVLGSATWSSPTRCARAGPASITPAARTGRSAWPTGTRA